MLGKGGMGGLMKQAQQMQENMKRMQDELAMTEFKGESGAGLVKVTILGNHDAKRVEIDDSLLSDDKEILEDLITAAINDAVRKAAEFQQEQMGNITGGMNLPAGFKLPF